MSRVDLHRALSVRACLPVLGWCLLGLCLGLPAWGQRSVPVEVEKRTESGDIKQIQELLLEENPEYARLSFGDALNATTKWSRGWESWWSSDGARFFRLQAEPHGRERYLYLDGATNWVVHDLVSMRDNSRRGARGIQLRCLPLQCTTRPSTSWVDMDCTDYHRKWLNSNAEGSPHCPTTAEERSCLRSTWRLPKWCMACGETTRGRATS